MNCFPLKCNHPNLPKSPNVPHAGDATGGISRDDFIDNVASGILEKLPVAFEVWRVKKQVQMNITPTGVVLLQELERFNLLVIRIKKTLELLRKVSCTQYHQTHLQHL